MEITKQEEDEPYIFHFPDGNTSIARLLVRSLIPASAPGHTMEDIVTAKLDYATLDDPGSLCIPPVTLLSARNTCDASAAAVEITCASTLPRPQRVALAANKANMVTSYLCPDLPDKQ